jgi:hypothetical protein
MGSASASRGSAADFKSSQDSQPPAGRKVSECRPSDDDELFEARRDNAERRTRWRNQSSRCVEETVAARGTGTRRRSDEQANRPVASGALFIDGPDVPASIAAVVVHDGVLARRGQVSSWHLALGANAGCHRKLARYGNLAAAQRDALVRSSAAASIGHRSQDLLWRGAGVLAVLTPDATAPVAPIVFDRRAFKRRRYKSALGVAAWTQTLRRHLAPSFGISFAGKRFPAPEMHRR